MRKSLLHLWCFCAFLLRAWLYSTGSLLLASKALRDFQYLPSCCQTQNVLIRFGPNVVRLIGSAVFSIALLAALAMVAGTVYAPEMTTKTVSSVPVRWLLCFFGFAMIANVGWSIIRLYAIPSPCRLLYTFAFALLPICACIIAASSGIANGISEFNLEPYPESQVWPKVGWKLERKDGDSPLSAAIPFGMTLVFYYLVIHKYHSMHTSQ